MLGVNLGSAGLGILGFRTSQPYIPCLLFVRCVHSLDLTPDFHTAIFYVLSMPRPYALRALPLPNLLSLTTLSLDRT